MGMVTAPNLASVPWARPPSPKPLALHTAYTTRSCVSHVQAAGTSSSSTACGALRRSSNSIATCDAPTRPVPALSTYDYRGHSETSELYGVCSTGGDVTNSLAAAPCPTGLGATTGEAERKGPVAGAAEAQNQPPPARLGRRSLLACSAGLMAAWFGGGGGGGGGGTAGGGWGARAAQAAEAAASTAGSAVDLSTLQEEAYLAYAERRFGSAVALLTDVIAAQPGEPRWREMRAEALVDGKNFKAALEDFAAAMQLTPGTDLVTRARLLCGRALAREGLGQWAAALRDYREGSELAAQAGESLDPYILNSIGNCLNSLGRWEEARESYLASAAVFQQARGFRGRNGSTTPRLDGAVFAASNAALMRAQLGDTEGAVQEMVRIARRAPGSADMRAALAALYWGSGRRQEAEEAWQFACERITVGCVKYTDTDWLLRIRRWPPAMVARLEDFLALR